MLIDTHRFGPLEVDDDRIITFAQGLLGFPEQRRYALLQTSSDPVFFWLQSVEDPTLAFVVCDPLAFVADYQVPIRQDDLDALKLAELTEAQVLVIVNKVGSQLTANLLGPLVMGARSLLGKQMVLSDKRYDTRHPLLLLEPVRAVAKTA